MEKHFPTYDGISAVDDFEQMFLAMDGTNLKSKKSNFIHLLGFSVQISLKF